MKMDIAIYVYEPDKIKHKEVAEIMCILYTKGLLNCLWILN